MRNLKTDWKSVRLTCACGRRCKFDPAQFGQAWTCAGCGAGVRVPASPEWEAFKALEWAVRPLASRWTPVSNLCRFGESARCTEFYSVADVGYQLLIWPDVAIWVRSDDLDQLARDSRGKGRPYPVEPPITSMPDGELEHFASITSRNTSRKRSGARVGR